MSRLILKPTLKLEGIDPSTNYEVVYDGETKQLGIGCQSFSLAEWKSAGADVIARQFARAEGCNNVECNICKALRPGNERRRAAAVRKYQPRLTRLIEHIERAEAALKKSLRAQTKRAN